MRFHLGVVTCMNVVVAVLDSHCTQSVCVLLQCCVFCMRHCNILLPFSTKTFSRELHLSWRACTISISYTIVRTVVYQNDFFMVVFHVGMICHQLLPMPPL